MNLLLVVIGICHLYFQSICDQREKRFRAKYDLGRPKKLESGCKPKNHKLCLKCKRKFDHHGLMLRHANNCDELQIGNKPQKRSTFQIKSILYFRENRNKTSRTASSFFDTRSLSQHCLTNYINWRLSFAARYYENKEFGTA